MEIRSTRTQLETRDTSDGILVQGYASTFNQPYTVGWFVEQVDPGAFTRSLAAGPDVRLLINHDGLPLARTRSGTLRLDADHTGLLARATLDPDDPDVRAILPKLRRGDLGEMSFAFGIAPGGDTWTGNLRTLVDLDIDQGDVSIVTYPANPFTSVGLRSVTHGHV